jgi:hypothetical protein
MAWTDPITFVSGNVLTAAQMNVIQANLLAGGPTYATEAARNTAIPSPFEGQRAYITGSTIAAATGTTTTVPTGIQTIYNGSAWVCVTPVGAYSHTSATTATLPYVTTLTGDATAISATISTGTTAIVDIWAMAKGSAVGTLAYLSFSVSNATTIAASDANGMVINSPVAAYNYTMGRRYIFSGLTAGTNTFTLNYGANTGTVTYTSRSLIVQAVA